MNGGEAVSPEAALLVEGNNRFALELYGVLATGEEENLFISPWSISTAFGMSWAGARGPTAEEMRTVLRFPFDQETTHPLFAELFDALGSLEAAGYLTLNSANAMWPAIGWAVLPGYAAIIEQYYHAYAESLDYIGATEASREHINQWVADNTSNRI
ncbi:MAG TPA: serpin family protein, partial [Oceanipulchritudo sp.]|nr:serpin family protein [Oceanipulchritudo sp.]